MLVGEPNWEACITDSGIWLTRYLALSGTNATSKGKKASPNWHFKSTRCLTRMEFWNTTGLALSSQWNNYIDTKWARTSSTEKQELIQDLENEKYLQNLWGCLTLFRPGCENYLDGQRGQPSSHFKAKKREFYGKWVQKLYSMKI